MRPPMRSVAVAVRKPFRRALPARTGGRLQTSRRQHAGFLPCFATTPPTILHAARSRQCSQCCCWEICTCTMGIQTWHGHTHSVHGPSDAGSGAPQGGFRDALDFPLLSKYGSCRKASVEVAPFLGGSYLRPVSGHVLRLAAVDLR